MPAYLAIKYCGECPFASVTEHHLSEEAYCSDQNEFVDISDYLEKNIHPKCLLPRNLDELERSLGNQ